MFLNELNFLHLSSRRGLFVFQVEIELNIIVVKEALSWEERVGRGRKNSSAIIIIPLNLLTIALTFMNFSQLKRFNRSFIKVSLL